MNSLFLKITSIVFLFVAAGGVYSFPQGQIIILACCLALVVASIYYKKFIFLAFPVLLIISNFTPWSGRFVFNEFDILILSLLGAWLGTTRISLPSRNSFVIPVILLFLLGFALPFSELFPLIYSPLTTNAYYSELYSFKIFKGFFYGFILSLILYSQLKDDFESTLSNLVYGGMLGTYVLFFLILWERGTLLALLNASHWWEVASSILDFASSYRVTALISDMHTGGESYDGYLLFLAPLNLLGCCYFKDTSKRLLALLALLCCGYCALVGFTRATYIALALSLICLYIYFPKTKTKTKTKTKQAKFPVKIGVLMGVILALSLFLYKLQGYMGIALFTVVFVSELLIKVNQQRLYKPHLQWLLSFIIFILGYYIISNNISKWIDNNIVNQMLSLGVFSLTIIMVKYWLSVFKVTSSGRLFFNGISMASLIMFITIIASSYQFNARLDTVSEDLKGRLQHWLNVVQSSKGGIKENIFGNGVGSFPLNYVLTHPETVEKVGSFNIVNDNLLLSKGLDLAFGQRVPISPNSDYQINIEIAEQEKLSLAVYLCERNLIFASNFDSNCVESRTTKKIIGGRVFLSAKVNSENVGSTQLALLKWPSTFYIKNHYSTKPIEIKNIELIKVNNRFTPINLLKNSNFEQGLDYWFFYNDFEHLPWHIKNVYLGFYYQIGLLGLIMVALMIFKLIVVEEVNAQHKTIQSFAIAYLTGLFSFGFFGDPLDSAKANLMFSLVLFGCYWYMFDLNNNKTKVKVTSAITVFSILITFSILSSPYFRSFWEQFKFYALTKSYIQYEENKDTLLPKPLHAPGVVLLDGVVASSLSTAIRKAKNNSEISIGKGTYNEAAILTKNNVNIIAQQGAVIFGKAMSGKGALVITGDNAYVEGLECHSIQVNDGNGVCIRLEGSGLHLNNVYFHHAQGGLLGSPKQGDIFIENSRFEYLGNNGFYHGIYTLEATNLVINNSSFINNYNRGHEVKSRSARTEITNSIIANTTTKDSRLVDVPNGGILILKNNLFIESPYSENYDLFSWGVEGVTHQQEKIIIEDNIIISDRASANLISMPYQPAGFEVINNIVVGDIEGVPSLDNTFFNNRADVNLPPAPTIPKLDK